MHRFSFVAFVITRLNFPGVRLRLWRKHTPCDEWECNTCNPFVDPSGRPMFSAV